MTKQVTLHYDDPNTTFEGTPYEAAQQSVNQANEVFRLFARAIKDTEIQARNAWMQRNIDLGGDPDAAGWEDSAEAKQYRTLLVTVVKINQKLQTLAQAASYDPKNPPKEDDK